MCLVSSPAGFISRFMHFILSEPLGSSLPTFVYSSFCFRSAANTSAVKLATGLAHQRVTWGVRGGSLQDRVCRRLRGATPFPKHRLEVDILYCYLSTKVNLFGKFQQNLLIHFAVLENYGGMTLGKQRKGLHNVTQKVPTLS